MKIPPKNPHFFKPILPGFNNGIKIPESFFFKYLDGKWRRQAVLRRGFKKWRLEAVNGKLLRGEGWSRFAVENSLEVGDFVVFRHLGSMEFEVSVFEDTHLERNADPIEAGRNPSKRIKSNGSGEEVLISDDEASGSPYFLSTIKPHSFQWSYLHVPGEFAISNGLIDRQCELILRDPQKRSWRVDLNEVAQAGVYLSRGSVMDEFFAANGLKEGDEFKFELIKNGATPIANFIPIFKVETRSASTIKNDGKERAKPGVDCLESDNLPYFVSTITSHSIKRAVLHLPVEFAMSNGLSDSNCEIILRDSRERPWYVNLEAMAGNRVRIGRGSTLNDFFAANGFKKGDSFKFELVGNGKKPVANLLPHSAIKKKTAGHDKRKTGLPRIR